MAKLDLLVTAVVKGEQNLKKLSGDLGKVDDQAKKAGKSFGGIGSAVTSFISPAALATGAAVGLGVAMIGAATAALAEEKGIAALTASLKANDPASVAHLDTIEATIKARENLAFADDEQRESLAGLVSVTKDTSKALDLQRTAMDLARLKGIDLATASQVLGKVYAGNVGILGRYGIQLQKGATSAEALAEIQKRAAGQAEAFADTTTGAVESLGIVFGDLVEDVGSALLPVLRDLALFIRDELIPFIRQLAPAIGAVGSAIGSVAGFITQFVNPFGAALDRQKEELKQHQEEEAKRLKAGEDAWLSYETTISDASDDIGGAVRALTAAEINELEAHWTEVRAAGFETTIQYQLGILDSQDTVKTAMAVLTRLQEEELTKAQQIAYLQGQLASQQLADGLSDPRSGVSGAARALRAEIIAELADLGVDAYNSGLSVPSNIAAGMYANAHLVDGASSYLAAKISGYLPRSDAEKGPLSNLSKVGPALVSTIVDGIKGSLSMADSASGSLASALTIGSLSGSQATGGASDASGGVTVNLTVQGDLRASERTLPGMIVRSLYASGLTPQ